MVCVKFTAFCDLRADLRIRLATLRKSARKFCFCKLISAKQIQSFRTSDCCTLFRGKTEVP